MNRWNQAKNGARQIASSVMPQREAMTVKGQIQALRHDLSNAVDCLELGNHPGWIKILGVLKQSAEHHIEEQLRKSATDPENLKQEIVIHYAMAQVTLGLIGIFETTVEREPLLRNKLINLEAIIREETLRQDSKGPGQL